MLVFRIIGTVLIGISVLTGLFKNITMIYSKDQKFDDTSIRIVVGASIWSVIWRAFVIVSLWVI